MAWCWAERRRWSAPPGPPGAGWIAWAPCGSRRGGGQGPPPGLPPPPQQPGRSEVLPGPAHRVSAGAGQGGPCRPHPGVAPVPQPPSPISRGGWGATKRSGPLAERDGEARVRRPQSCPCGHRDVVGGNSATGLCSGHLETDARRPAGDVRTLIEDPIRRLLDGADPQPMLSAGVTHRLRASPRSWSRSPHVQQPGAGAHSIRPTPGPEQPDRGGNRSRRRSAADRSFTRSVGIRPAPVGRGAAPN